MGGSSGANPRHAIPRRTTRATPFFREHCRGEGRAGRDAWRLFDVAWPEEASAPGVFPTTIATEHRLIGIAVFDQSHAEIRYRPGR